MPERFSCDTPKLTRDEATELCVYHLRMAAAFFQIVPDDNNVSLNDEIDRQFGDDAPDCDVRPARVWAAEIYRIYEEMKKQ